jgi:hypothetical protein
MKWIVLAIVLVLVPYTYLTLHYRKPEPAFRPYQDMQDRANTIRLLSAGYQRITVEAQRSALASANPLTVSTTAAPAGLPAELRATLLVTPLLPTEILAVAAAPLASTDAPYPIQFTCTLPDEKHQLADAELYVRGGEIFVTPNFEHLAGALAVRSRETIVQLSVPAGVLKRGHYQVTIAGEHASRTWMLQVN